MAKNVFEKVMQRCESALRARIPIIYIKTDSDLLINRIVDSDRLVVRVRKAGSIGLRPERDFDGVKNIPENHFTGDIGKKNYLTWDYPRICTFKVPKDWKNQNGYEEYILAHENPEHSKYDLLQSCVVILYSSTVQLSPMMQAYTEIIDVDYPDTEEIRNSILNSARLFGDDYLEKNEQYLSQLCTEFSGLSNEEIDVTMRKILSDVTSAKESPLSDDGRVMGTIRRRKEQKMETSVLELCKKPQGNIGGMNSLRSWLSQQKFALENAEMLRRKKGIMPPKGVLLCGIPGCGKSEAAKLTAQEFGLPLLKMDVGKLMDKYQGESERNMHEALLMAEAMSPCVLWIDELEKGFSGAGSDSNDSASFKRMFATMLGWMQDNTKPVFIFATANNIGGLPKEFFRSGRFDALFAVYLPLMDECIEIFKACMKWYRSENGKSVFEEGCDDAELFRYIFDRCFVRNGKPRILIGADIRKIVNVAVRSLGDRERIDCRTWRTTLEKVCSDLTVSVYGDGEENVDSIAVSYCRMLRKGLQPTASRVLFSARDYCPENAADKKDILVCKNNGLLKSEYDKALYSLLSERINKFAPDVEEIERRNNLMR